MTGVGGGSDDERRNAIIPNYVVYGNKGGRVCLSDFILCSARDYFSHLKTSIISWSRQTNDATLHNQYICYTSACLSVYLNICLN